MRPNRPSLLVTGFGPFPGMARNPSAELAMRVARSPRWRRLGVGAECLLLPTTYAALDTELEPALASRNPDAVLMIGVAGRARRVRIERRAVNRASLFPDAAGRRPSRLTLGGGDPVRRARVHPERVRALLRRHGIACGLSQDAGRYLCNAAYYRALAAPIPVLFIHIPKPPSRRRALLGGRRRMTWREGLAAALVEVAVQLLPLTLPGQRRPAAVAAHPAGL